MIEIYFLVSSARISDEKYAAKLTQTQPLAQSQKPQSSSKVPGTRNHNYSFAFWMTIIFLGKNMTIEFEDDEEKENQKMDFDTYVHGSSKNMLPSMFQ